MNTRVVLISALIAAVPATYGLGYTKAKGLCNAPRIAHAFRDVAQGTMMNLPLVGDVYQLGLENGLEATCWEERGAAFFMLGEAKRLNLEWSENWKW